MKAVVFLLVLLAACAPAPQQINEMDSSYTSHLGCMPEEVAANGTCAVAAVGERNVDLFDSLDASRVHTENVSYFGKSRGFLAAPKEKGVYPAVVMIHEWWGLNNNIKNMAVLLAQEGYVVLAVDIYEGKVANSSDEARALTSSVKQPRANENMRAAVEFLRGRSDVDASKIGSIGWCFGGGQSLQLALSGEKLQATIIYYGQLSSNETLLRQIEWPVLGVFAELDSGIPPARVNEFKAALDNVGVENDVTIYPNVNHAFANPSGARYAANETRDAWKKTVTFLNRTLKNE